MAVSCLLVRISELKGLSGFGVKKVNGNKIRKKGIKKISEGSIVHVGFIHIYTKYSIVDKQTVHIFVWVNLRFA